MTVAQLRKFINRTDIDAHATVSILGPGCRDYDVEALGTGWHENGAAYVVLHMAEEPNA